MPVRSHLQHFSRVISASVMLGCNGSSQNCKCEKSESVLVIRASPRSDGHSNRVTDKFLEAFRKKQPQTLIKEWWLHDENSRVPEFGQVAINGKRGGASDNEKAAWNQVLSVINEFKSA